jgi:predicted GNAT family N-acyltransferase
MTAHDPRVFAFAAEKAGSPRPARFPLDKLNTQLSERLVVFTPTGSQVNALVDLARKAIPRLADNSVVHGVVSHNPDTLWAIARRSHYKSSAGEGEGLVAFLMLNDAGLKSLLRGSFDAADPDLSMIVRQHEKPAGIYVWGIHSPGIIAGGVALTVEKISSKLYRDVDVYARAATAQGLRLMQTMGFESGAEYCGVRSAQVYVYRRRPGTLQSSPIYDNYSSRASRRELSVTVARSIEDVMRVMTIRSAVYMSEQNCPYGEEFDGNDFSATHLIGYVGDEPAACLRIRYFSDFVKMERLAVRREFRKSRLAFKIVRAGIELCRTKGYRKIYGHSQKRLLNFWSRFGFRPFEGSKEFVFSDFDYIEVSLDMTPHPQAISIGVDPYIMIRPEGRWHLPGILERSAVRPPTRPSVGCPSTRSVDPPSIDQRRQRVTT